MSHLLALVTCIFTGIPARCTGAGAADKGFELTVTSALSEVPDEVPLNTTWGAVPDWLQGTFYKNGPGRFEWGNRSMNHVASRRPTLPYLELISPAAPRHCATSTTGRECQGCPAMSTASGDGFLPLQFSTVAPAPLAVAHFSDMPCRYPSLCWR